MLLMVMGTNFYSLTHSNAIIQLKLRIRTAITLFRSGGGGGNQGGWAKPAQMQSD